LLRGYVVELGDGHVLRHEFGLARRTTHARVEDLPNLAAATAGVQIGHKSSLKHIRDHACPGARLGI
jgi:hypothetical protein